MLTENTVVMPKGGQRIDLAEVQADWRLLDSKDFEIPRDVCLISHEQFTVCPGLDVKYVRPGFLPRMFSWCLPVFKFLYAVQLLHTSTPRSVLILNGGDSLWVFVGLLNRIAVRKRAILCWDIFVEVKAAWKRAIYSWAMAAFRVNVLWSRRQIAPHAAWLGLPEERFIYLPYKANHSKYPFYDLQIGNYIFAGGNGKRDYQTLAEAVKGTDIPVVISATDPAVRKSIPSLPNIVTLAAWEPAFAQLQAGSRFVVVPMIYTGLKGGGEANFCNAMWHGKPVIAADSIAAMDYILDGETGYVVPSGDVNALRERIMELWNDPEKVQKVGAAGKRHVEENFTHQAFIRRLLRLAFLISDEHGVV